MQSNRPVRRRLAHTACAFALLLTVYPAGSSDAGPDQESIDRFITDRLHANNLPGVAVAITAGDRVLHLEGYGDAGAGEPVTPETQFRIGSLSKSFTAAAVLRLVEDGTVSLDAPVVDYLPDFRVDDPRSDRITVRHLLNHTSGLSDQAYPAGAHPPLGTLADRVSDLSSARLVADPGTSFNYFNLNYAVAARVVEVVGGEPFAQYVQRNLLEPLGMGDTFEAATGSAASAQAQRLAQGHVLLYGQAMARDELDGFLGGYGGMVSTAEDLAKWLTAQAGSGGAGGGVLAPQARRIMHTPPDGVDTTYGMGWVRSDPAAGPTTLEHTGVLSTFYAEQTLLPDDGYGLVLLFNSYHALVDYHGFSAGLVELINGEQPSSPWATARVLGLLVAALTLLTLTIRVRRLLQVRAWASRRIRTSWWRLAPGFAWLLLPAALLVALQSIIATFTGRLFTYPQLFWAMPEVTTWLAIAAVTGVVLLIVRLLLLVRRRSQLRG
jgi:CubicO group peptidase (beta-lactamase class C family)